MLGPSTPTTPTIASERVGVTPCRSVACRASCARTMPRFVYLASQSPRRQQLLTSWGVDCRLLLPDTDEDAEALEHVRDGEAPSTYVRRVTRLKLQAALERLQRRGWDAAPVLCADTTVALGRDILGKPADADEACRMLARLAGRRHRVLTAVALALPQPQGDVWRGEALSVSWVEFTPLDADQIGRYVASGEPMGKAGAYAIQGRAALWARRLSGSYTGIMGLPAHETAQLLRQVGCAID